MLKDETSAQIIHFQVKILGIDYLIMRKNNQLLICKYTWSINQLTGYNVTALLSNLLNTLNINL